MSGVPKVEELLAAYAAGWFPMDIHGQVGFYECDPRAVLPLERFRVPRSVRRALRATPFEARFDTAFPEVVAACGGERHGGSWLTPRLSAAYGDLHAAGFAHSVETWLYGRLVGGLFGVAVGGLFTSESMFHHVSDAGSATLVAAHRHLADRGYLLWDIQMTSEHTERFGAVGIAPDEYRVQLAAAIAAPATFAD